MMPFWGQSKEERPRWYPLICMLQEITRTSLKSQRHSLIHFRSHRPRLIKICKILIYFPREYARPNKYQFCRFLLQRGWSLNPKSQWMQLRYRCLHHLKFMKEINQETKKTWFSNNMKKAWASFQTSSRYSLKERSTVFLSSRFFQPRSLMLPWSISRLTW